MNIREEQQLKKLAHKQLVMAADALMQDFLAACPSAVPLRSYDPAAAWKAGGCIHFASVKEFAGPGVDDDIDSPVIAGLQVNLDPPEALTEYHLKSPAFRRQLGVGQNATIATDPTLTVNTLPDEIASFGSWLADWIDYQFRCSASPPKPPIQLIWWGSNATGEPDKVNFEKMSGLSWRKANFLWTPKAIAAHEPWLKQLV